MNEQAIAIEIDDVLNDFSVRMNESGIIFDSRLHTIANPDLNKCLYNLNTGRLTPVGEIILGSAAVRKDGQEFLGWLHDNGWTIVLFTYRDLRIAYDITAKWLHDNGVFYDFLFFVDNISYFCKEMKITHLICNKPNRFEKLSGFTFCPLVSGKRILGGGIIEFNDFEEVKQCLQK